jgi:hypothetical protein
MLMTMLPQQGNSFYGLAIGFMVFVAVQAAGPISGGAFNPAVGTGLPLMSGVHESMDDIWIYWFGPLMGAFLAAIFFNFTVSSREPPPLSPIRIALGELVTSVGSRPTDAQKRISPLCGAASRMGLLR